MRIRDRQPADDETIRRLNDRAFGGVYESNLVDDLRTADLAAVELIAVADDAIVGHILFSRLGVTVSGKPVEALALAPMAVLPEQQRRGIGSALVRAGLEAALARGWRAVIVLGHADFYARFGFSPERARHLEAPFAGRSFMAIELAPGALDGDHGSVVYPAAFGIDR